MRLMAVCLLSILAACGGDGASSVDRGTDGGGADPITATCERVCTVAIGSACVARQNDCIEECRSYGRIAQTKGGPNCAECVCGSYQYAVDAAGVCRGFYHQGELTPACKSSCAP